MPSKIWYIFGLIPQLMYKVSDFLVYYLRCRKEAKANLNMLICLGFYGSAFGFQLTLISSYFSKDIIKES